LLKNGRTRSTPHASDHASLTPILSFDTSRGVRVAVAGIEDQALVARIVAAAKRSLKHVVGKWTLKIAPAGSRGEWRMELRGTAGVHVWVFSSRTDALPDGTHDKLAAFLKRSASTHR
jgi:hypothetical protein